MKPFLNPLPCRSPTLYLAGLQPFTVSVFNPFPYRSSTFYRVGLQPFTVSVLNPLPCQSPTLYHVGLQPFTMSVFNPLPRQQGLGPRSPPPAGSSTPPTGGRSGPVESDKSRNPGMWSAAAVPGTSAVLLLLPLPGTGSSGRLKKMTFLTQQGVGSNPIIIYMVIDPLCYLTLLTLDEEFQHTWKHWSTFFFSLSLRFGGFRSLTILFIPSQSVASSPPIPLPCPPRAEQRKTSGTRGTSDCLPSFGVALGPPRKSPLGEPGQDCRGRSNRER